MNNKIIAFFLLSLYPFMQYAENKVEKNQKSQIEQVAEKVILGSGAAFFGVISALTAKSSIATFFEANRFDKEALSCIVELNSTNLEKLLCKDKTELVKHVDLVGSSLLEQDPFTALLAAEVTQDVRDNLQTELNSAGVTNILFNKMGQISKELKHYLEKITDTDKTKLSEKLISLMKRNLVINGVIGLCAAGVTAFAAGTLLRALFFSKKVEKEKQQFENA